ncbi:MAG: TPM domain-containing protein [Deltaproteobacteria bacterium]|nr:TPM domain-containing protein [Deltaproteobacteria bacterium]
MRRSELDLDRIRGAVEAAERLTSAEIVVSIAPFFLGRVWKAARRAFGRLGIATTRGRNGVLVFVVPSRRQVVILADDAALTRIDPSVWSDVAGRIAIAFARGHGTRGITDGVTRLGAVLAAPFPRGPGDAAGELPDEPHVGRP